MKTAILISLAILMIVIAAVTAAGNFFVNFGLVRKDRKEPNEHLQGELPDRSDNEDPAVRNHRSDKRAVVEWKKTVNTEKVKITSFDGLKLAGNVFFPKAETFHGEAHKWVILVHGYSGGKTEMEPFAMRYSSRGYMVLCADCRGHGESEGRFAGMGYLDGKDILAWMEHIIAMDQEAQIILHGHSMGGAAVVTACGSSSLRQLKAAVADCAFSSAHEMFAKQLKEWFGLPSFPVLTIAQLVFSLRGGYRFKDARAINFAPEIQVPILYIHGAEDKFVPVGMSRELYDKTKAPKDILIVPGAAHAQSQDKDPEGYYKAVFDFIREHTDLQ